jgi:hypothetical protein
MEKLYKHELLPLPFHRIESFTDKVVAELSANNKSGRKNQPQEAIRNIGIDIVIPDLKVRKATVQDVTI